MKLIALVLACIASAAGGYVAHQPKAVDKSALINDVRMLNDHIDNAHIYFGAGKLQNAAHELKRIDFDVIAINDHLEHLK